MKPWFYNEQSITEFKEPVAYKGLNISVTKTKVKPPYIATVTSPATGKEVVKMGGDTEQAALDSAKQAVDKREADAPKISAGGQTSILFNTPSNDELLKDPSMYNTVYAKISKDKNGPTLVIGNEVYGAADLEASGFVGSYDRRTKRGRDSEETLPQVMFNANNKLLSQIGIKMNGRYTLDTAGKYRDEDEHTVYPLQFQGSTVHAGDRLRMNRPALTIGATREDIQPWFQRELEEADIIKFPEPESKVLDMPSVASYPDFLTGVKDLHSRLEKGEISQASHDRLYQDLIHRFMKKESFETPWFLREQDGGGVGQAAKDLIATANASDDPEYEKETQNLLVKARDFLKKILGKPQTEDVAPQVEALPTEIVALLQKVKTDANYTPEQFKNVETQLIQSFGRKQREAQKRGEKTGIEKGRNELNDFLKNFDSAIDALTNKITSSEQAFVDANSGDTGKTMRKEVARKQNTIDVLKGVISSIFTGDLFQAKNINNMELQKKLLSFLNASKEGIVDWGTIMTAGKGKTASIDQFVPAEYREIFEMFKDKLFNSRPPTTAGAWGPGEVGLILIGNPVTKAGDGGDLQDSKTGDKFELKGSKNSKKGGRLSPKGLSKEPNSKLFKVVKDKHIGAKRLQKLGTKSRLNYSSLNQGFVKAYNELIDQGVKIDTKAFLTDTIMAAFTTKRPTDKELAPYVKQMIIGGKIDYAMFVKTYAKFLFDRYQGKGEEQAFKNIIVFNPTSTSYTVLDSSKDLDHPDLDITGGIEFGADQVPKSPQIGIK